MQNKSMEGKYWWEELYNPSIKNPSKMDMEKDIANIIPREYLNDEKNPNAFTTVMIKAKTAISRLWRIRKDNVDTANIIYLQSSSIVYTTITMQMYRYSIIERITLTKSSCTSLNIIN